MFGPARDKNSTTDDVSKTVVKSYSLQDGLAIHCTNAGEAGLFVSVIVTDARLAESERLLRRLYEAVAKILIENAVELVHERVFASKSSTTLLLSSRLDVFNTAGLDPNTPLSLIQVSPCFGNGVAGLLFHAVSAESGIETLRNEVEKPIGRRWSTSFADYLVLQPVCKTALPVEMQIADFFERTAFLLNQQGFSFIDVARTWFYINNILKNYHIFNRVRDQKFAEFGLTQNTPPKFPASTGIAGAAVNGSSMVADLLAVKPKLNKIKFLSNPQQKEAFEYGAAFSRAALIQEQAVDFIQVSGTASIGEDGKTLYPYDGTSQIACALDKFEALLETANASFDHVATASIFVKTPALFETFKRIGKTRGITNFPGVPVLADVCREDLLFEIDAEVILPKR